MTECNKGLEFCNVRIKGAFESPRLLLARAKEHVADLERCVSPSLSPDRWTPIVETDPQTGDRLIKVRLSDSITIRASVIALDVVNNLRSTLDHAVYASSIALFGGDPKNTSFPMGFKDEASFNNELGRLRKKKAEIAPEIIDLITGFKPYEAGNETLFSLNQLRNRKAHRVLIPVGITASGWNINVFSHTGESVSGGAWDNGKNELTLAVVPKETNFAADIRATINIAIYGIPGMESKPAVAAFHTFASEIERILMDIEAETFRLLRIINP